ncbi:MAG: exodeoxyribonuclease III [Gammaproteobacteria bacterium]|nr:exodeoxyribonuclease III [Gammaproteobacteria bacterium]
MKIATWNVNSLRVRLPHVLDWLASANPDVLCLQETKVPNEDFPLLEIQQAGYEVVFSGQKSYNGVAVISKQAAHDILFDLPEMNDTHRRVIAVTVGNLRVINLYVPNGESVGSDKYAYKLEWLRKLKDFLEQQIALYPSMVIVGDFNIAPTDDDVYDPIEWHGRVLCSEPERSAFKELLELGFQDCFRLQPQPSQSFSWWDYRLNAFERNWGLRIDHILASPALALQCIQCGIDKKPRGLERPSDHAPVFAEFVT